MILPKSKPGEAGYLSAMFFKLQLFDANECAMFPLRPTPFFSNPPYLILNLSPAYSMRP